MPNAQNKEMLASIKEDLDGVSAMWVVDYRGLTVKEMQQLRGDIRGQTSVKGAKNTLVHLALARPTADARR
ncbi:MAG: 50S ribosomal protein L10 [Adlercreutzia equolifaciens]